MIRGWLLVAALQAPADPGHLALAQQARSSFATGVFDSLFSSRQVIRLETTGGAIGPPVRGSLAATLLRSRTRRQRTVAVSVVRNAAVEGRLGFVELRRVFRVAGAQETRRERILLATVLDADRWRVTEILFLEGQPDRDQPARD
ncbi:MAG: hypothetical protein ACKVZ0_11075 [Gemmatimonadales bacterium]